MHIRHLAAIICLSALLAAPAAASPLGIAGGYNEFILTDIDLSDTDSFGGVAAGGNVTFKNVSVASRVETPLPDGDLVVGGDLYFGAGSVGYFDPLDPDNPAYKQGAIVVGGTATLGTTNGGTNVGFGSLTYGQPIDFDAEWDHLTGRSASWSALPANGTTDILFDGDVISLTGTDPLLNVFSLDAADIGQDIGFKFYAPETSTLLVNVSGNAAALQHFGFFFNDLEGDKDIDGLFPDDRILYNFFEADTLVISGIEVHGSILAPHAMVNFYDGHIEGNLIAWALAGDPTGEFFGGEAHDEYFDGDLPPVAEPSILVLIGCGLVVLGLARKRGRVMAAAA